ncbi:hypothetical protein KJ840_02085 [Patescibacteria group bacterium]|nr:hypothetical protein [Patescibacteria group bacterium]
MLKEIALFFRGINRKYFADYFAALLLAFIFFSWLQSSPTLPEPDSFYHAKMAVFLSDGQMLSQFPWLQEIGLAENFVDHHFLYHLILAPFVRWFDPLIGVKIATIIFASLAVLLIYWLFKKFEIKWPFLFMVILLASQPWLFRASLVKAPAVLLSFLLFAFYFVAHQKYKSLAFISFLAVWLYAGWPLLPALVILYILLVWFLEKIKDQDSIWFRIKGFLKIKKNKVVPWPGAMYCLGGIIAGLIINPYFPYNLNFYWQQTVKIALINYQNIIGVGGEWYPYGFINLITDASLVCALLVVSLLVFILTFKKQSVYSWFWGILAVLFFLLTLKSRRNVEFFIPFAVIFSAFAFSDCVKRLSFVKMKMLIGASGRAILGIIFLIISLSFLVQIPKDLTAAKRDINNGWPLDHYQEASYWLKENTPPGSIVFNADWDDFPFLFYYNSHNYYLLGLDPTFMYEKNQKRYQKYVDITLGKIGTNLKQIIKEEFKADYVFLDNQHAVLNNNLRLDPNFDLVYYDNEGKIYQVTD